MVAMTEKIANREGLGDILADGVKRAAEKIGRGAEKFAVHIGGQELGMHDRRFRHRAPIVESGPLPDGRDTRTSYSPFRTSEFYGPALPQLHWSMHASRWPATESAW